MTSVRIVWLLLCVIWLTAEIKLARKNAVDKGAILAMEKRSQSLLWITVVICLLFALLFKTLEWLPIPIAYLPRQFLALLLFAGGLYLRYVAISRLGQFFTTHVSIQQGHRLITEGPYRRVRHPAYSGLLLAFTAIGLAMGDIIGLLILTIPTSMALMHRITIEEDLLQKQFGNDFLNYCQSTKKLMPGLF